MPLNPTMFDWQTGELLPHLGDVYETELEGIPPEVVAEYGEQVRLDYIRETAARQAPIAKERYGAPYRPKKPVVEAPATAPETRPPEPARRGRRIYPQQPKPVYDGPLPSLPWRDVIL
jgi:hypothetical protein